MTLIRLTEAQAQAALFDFLSRIEGQIPAVRWAFHPANGGWRHKATAAALKRQGVKRGVPDMLCPVSIGTFHGLAIELKVGHNKPSPDQAVWLDHLERQGWRCAVCWSWEDAARELLRYLGATPEEYGL